MLNIKYDISEPYQLGFQDPATIIMEEIINFHNYVCVYLALVLLGVGWILANILWSYLKANRVISHKFLVHGTLIEIIWTITPAIILVLIAFPSFILELWSVDEGNIAFDVSREVQAATVVDGPASCIYSAGMTLCRFYASAGNRSFNMCYVCIIVS